MAGFKALLEKPRGWHLLLRNERALRKRHYLAALTWFYTRRWLV